MGNVIQQSGISIQYPEATFSKVSRDLLIDVIMHAGERNDEHTSRLFISFYQQLLNDEDRFRTILNSISIPEPLAQKASQYLCEISID